MSLSADLREFIGLLNSRSVEYVIVGAHSLAFHARPRYTGDVDILVRPTAKNAIRIKAVLNEFGFGKIDIADADILQPGQMIQLGRAPNRIDLLTSLTGVETDEVFQTKIETELDGLPVVILSKALLIKNKRAVGRTQDLADLEALEQGD